MKRATVLVVVVATERTMSGWFTLRTEVSDERVAVVEASFCANSLTPSTA